MNELNRNTTSEEEINYDSDIEDDNIKYNNILFKCNTDIKCDNELDFDTNNYI